MARRSLIGAFRDPVSRPRAIIWLTVTIIGLALFVVMGGIIGTSTEWFCAVPCHKVQADTISAYHASSHSQISCVACHEPANGTPIQILLAKAKSMGEIPPTVTNTFELPLNPLSALALNTHEMGSKQCVQCHSDQRKITTSEGIIIDHKVHEEDGVTCTTCHNRIAHNDTAIKLELEGNRPHKNFMKMDACFRCHDLAGQRRAKGDCNLCHPVGFNLVPETHVAEGWLPKEHATAAKESLTEYGVQKVEAEELIAEGVSEEVAVPVEYCSTCHLATFCDACHAQLAGAVKLPETIAATVTAPPAQ